MVVMERWSLRLNSLIKLHEHVDLREDQLDTVLESLNDFNQMTRNSVAWNADITKYLSIKL